MQDALDNDHAITSKKPQELMAYWNKLANSEGGIPRRSDFDPIAIPSALPSLFLFERLDADTYRLRLQGTDFGTRGIVDLTGALLERSKTDQGQGPIFQVLDQVSETPCGVHLLGVEQSSQGRESLVEYVVLPLLDESGDVTFVVASGSPLATLGYDDDTTEQSPLTELRSIREIPLAVSKENAV